MSPRARPPLADRPKGKKGSGKVKVLPGGISFNQHLWKQGFAARHGVHLREPGAVEVMVEDLD